MDCFTVRYEVLPKQKNELLQWVCLENWTYPWLHFIAPKGILPSSQHPAPVHYPVHNTLHLSITHFTTACTCPLPSSQQFTLFHPIFTIQYNIWNYFSLFPALQIVPYVTTGGLLQPLKQRVTSKYSSKHDNLLNSLRAVSDFVWSAWISVTF